MSKKSGGKYIDRGDVLLLLKKSKRGFLKIIFGRTTFILLMLLAQFLIMFYGLYLFSEYVVYLFTSAVVISLIMIITVVNSPSNPTIKMTWIALLGLVPVFGVLLYIYVETDIGYRLVKKNLSDIIRDTVKYVPDQSHLDEKIYYEAPEIYNLTQYMKVYGNAPVYENSAVTYFPLGEDMFDSLIEELNKAEKFIFLEYFIVSEGYMWGRVLKILKEKAEQGVEVRMLYDGTCAFTLLPYDYPQQLQKLHIKCKMFSPIRPMVSSHYNNRDHRKIVVIDGHTAFTGGANLADEYINMRQVYGHWKDTSIMIKGEAVRSFTLMFLQMWNIGERSVDYPRFMNVSAPVPENAEGYIIPYGDSPLDSELVGEMVYMDILNTAKRYVHITTPYLILDNEMITALSFAAKRGVDVKIILPHIPDKKIIFALSRSYYKTLMEAGVKIYEYTPGFVHAKTFVSDDNKAVVGTINLDYRSLYLHFECAAYMYKVPAIKDIVMDFDQTLEKCQLVTFETLRSQNIFYRLLGKILKIIAPIT